METGDASGVGDDEPDHIVQDVIDLEAGSGSDDRELLTGAVRSLRPAYLDAKSPLRDPARAGYHVIPVYRDCRQLQKYNSRPF